MAAAIRRWESPDETRRFDRGRFDVLTLGGVTVGRARYEPGWKWSEHVGSATGSRWCMVEHVGMVVSGRAVIAMRDGERTEVGPGDLFAVGPGHDSWVVGDEPYVSVHLLGAGHYAR